MYQQRIGERRVGETHQPGRCCRIWQVRGERSQRASMLVGAVGRGEFAVVQFERRVGQFASEVVGALVEGVPPAGGVPGQQQQPDRRGPGRPVAHRADQVREHHDVEVGVVDDQQRRPVERQLRPAAWGLRVGETGLPPLAGHPHARLRGQPGLPRPARPSDQPQRRCCAVQAPRLQCVKVAVPAGERHNPVLRQQQTRWLAAQPRRRRPVRRGQRQRHLGGDRQPQPRPHPGHAVRARIEQPGQFRIG